MPAPPFRRFAILPLFFASMLVVVAGMSGCSPTAGRSPEDGRKNELVRKFAISHDGRLLASLSSENPSYTILIRDLATRERIHTLEYHDLRPIEISFHPLRNCLMAFYYDGSVVFWDLTGAAPTQTLIGRIVPGQSDGGTYATLSNDGKLVAAADNSGAVVVWNTETHTRIQTLQYDSKPMALAFTPDGGGLAAAGNDAGIVQWDLATGAARRFPGSEQCNARCAAISPDGTRLLAAGFDGNVQMWNLSDGTLEWTQRISSAVLPCLATTRDGGFAAVGTSGGDVFLISLRDRKPPQLLREHGNLVTSVAFADDGRLYSSSLYGDVVSGSWISRNE